MPNSENLCYKVIICVVAVIAVIMLVSSLSDNKDSNSSNQNSSKRMVRNSSKNTAGSSCMEQCLTIKDQETCQKLCQKENFMVYPDQLKLVSDRTKMLGGSLITSSNNPFMGALPNEAKFGVTAPQRQGPVTVSLSNSGNEAKALWSTIV